MSPSKQYKLSLFCHLIDQYSLNHLYKPKDNLESIFNNWLLAISFWIPLILYLFSSPLFLLSFLNQIILL